MRTRRLSHVGRLAIALGATLLALAGSTGASTASPASGDFAARAQAVGLTEVPTDRMQKKMDDYLERADGTRVT